MDNNGVQSIKYLTEICEAQQKEMKELWDAVLKLRKRIDALELELYESRKSDCISIAQQGMPHILGK